MGWIDVGAVLVDAPTTVAACTMIHFRWGHSEYLYSSSSAAGVTWEGTREKRKAEMWEGAARATRLGGRGSWNFRSILSINMFRDVPPAAVKRENIKEFFRWAFLNTDMDDPIYDDEVEGYVKNLEIGTGMSFEYGRADVKCLRLTLDKVGALHRSLVWYSVRLLLF
jgi:hypothetical protein